MPKKLIYSVGDPGPSMWGKTLHMWGNWLPGQPSPILIISCKNHKPGGGNLFFIFGTNQIGTKLRSSSHTPAQALSLRGFLLRDWC